MKKFCKNCGAEVTSKFCESCGAMVNETEDKVSNQSFNSIPPQQLKSVGKPRKKRGCLTIIIVIVVLFTLLVTTISNNQKKKGTTDGGSKQENETNSEEKKEEDKVVMIGQEESIGDLKMIVNEVNEVNEITFANGYMVYRPDSGKYAVVNVTIKNPSKNSESLLINYFHLIGSDEAKYNPTIITATDEKYITVDSINPNLEITGNLVFEIPTELSASECRLQYSDFDILSDRYEFSLK